MALNLSATYCNNGVRTMESRFNIYNQVNPHKILTLKEKNSCIRRELLNAYLFNSLAEVRCLSEEWRIDYNTERPHKSLGYLSPLTYAEQYYKRSMTNMKLYPQTANGNHVKIEESRLVKKCYQQIPSGGKL